MKSQISILGRKIEPIAVVSVLLIGTTIGCADVSFDLAEDLGAQKKGAVGDLPHPVTDHLDDIDKNLDDHLSDEEIDKIIDREKDVDRPEEDALACERIRDRHKNAPTISDSSIIGRRGFFVGQVASPTGLTSVAQNFGVFKIFADRIINLEHNRGIFAFLGKSNTSTMDTMDSGRGLTLVCDMDIAVVSDFRGLLIVVNGSVGKVTNSRGIVRVHRGDIGLLRNHMGYVRVSQGRILDKENNLALIRVRN